ncbi:glutamate 5-kinase [Acinetobacter baylyi]|uniref:Glutamate 5-kinase n=1 Tax=Acinetobacter baylyi (strain ATCC 33305 / BD413 / ADP1) TaxID=62977 RepID=PROB_ACIAD|nr:glutamate 5-kinase [Acinetobacter baylyi]Q6F9D9.1 RecName: Full=Glutamate 5-kinase; AltName: Full=Gamma-glutamyl kinase; Short=GK [Acinetobacter baylyi ADP1]ENV53573.1 glutamate 5-kinase [Acinetobacter baylyi DSM 14961 = CIP 107474]KAF2371897.1 glutamate 5-kinase [Acinetobacter baylyi]KAF2375249.1 glutamate 5-kinase [Acinetobacter baylyi]KAF2376012.1 glutamate 5-kinase [Acinetobacter baylyi]KAF2382676.1 glutamate 5-kinase [Acinetobacter baylyi]
MIEVIDGQRQLKACKRIVVKIGSSLLTANGQGLDLDAISHWAMQIADLHNAGHEIILVSSGAVAEGMVRMKLTSRPTDLPSLQACAAIGQMGLIHTWSSVLEKHTIQTAQVLLTHDDLADRRRYLNSCDALQNLIEWRVIPVINENDTVSTDEIRFGDNDTLAAMVAGQVHADLLIILTDQQGMFDSDPRSNPNAKLLTTVNAMDDALFEMAGGGGVLGRGGMVTKVRAARLAAKSGCPTLIASGESDHVLSRLMSGELLGTLFSTDKDRITAHQQWLAAHLQTAGRLVIDAGAVEAIKQRHRSLLPVGVKAVEGHFNRGDVVECVDQSGQRVAVGRVNFSSRSAEIIKGLASDKVHQVLGEARSLEMIHRNHMAIY